LASSLSEFHHPFLMTGRAKMATLAGESQKVLAFVLAQVLLLIRLVFLGRGFACCFL